jgi:hypothetical protein
MIEACTTLEQTVNQIRLRLASGRRAAFKQENTQRYVQAHNHHEVVGLMRGPGMPCPPRWPDHGQGVQKQTGHTGDNQCDLKESVCVCHRALLAWDTPTLCCAFGSFR